MYAIIETGGKQYKVREGDTVEVELLGDDIGDTVELGEVLMVAGDGDVTVGSPTVEGAIVKATVLDEVKGDKVVVFKYKPSSRYRVKTGHRQRYNRLRIDAIVLPGSATDDGRDASEAEEETPTPVAATAETVVDETEAIAVDVAEETDEPEVAEDVEAEAGDDEEVGAEVGDDDQVEAEADVEVENEEEDE